MIEGLVQYDIPFTKVEEHVMKWAAEALDLRHGDAGDPDGPLGLLPVDATVHDMALYLHRLKTRVDRVDYLILQALQAKGKAARAYQGANFKYEKQFDEASNRVRSKKLFEDYSSGKERASEATLEVFDQKRLAYQADRLAKIATEAYDVIKEVKWQLEAMRKDVRASLHGLQFTTSIEN